MSNEQFSLQFGPTASALILAVSRGLASEIILCIGTRGEGKTCAALASMGAHATEHKRAGYPLPVPWATVMDTFQSHKEKTHKSLLKPFWQGAWRIADGGHTAVLNCGGVDGVVLSMFGIRTRKRLTGRAVSGLVRGLMKRRPRLKAAALTSLFSTCWQRPCAFLLTSKQSS